MQLHQAKLAGGEIGISETETIVVGVNRAEIVGALGIEQIQLAHSTGADDLSDVARNNLPRLRLARLIANRDPPAGLDQLCDVGLRCVIRHAAHRHAVALRQRDIQ